MVHRRGELMVQLFLQDLAPGYIGKPQSDFGYDFIIGIPNASGGINTTAVITKATERPVPNKFQLAKDVHKIIAYSNIPVLLLVANVKQNQLYYAWITPQLAIARSMAKVPVSKIDQESIDSIRKLVAGIPRSLG